MKTIFLMVFKVFVKKFTKTEHIDLLRKHDKILYYLHYEPMFLLKLKGFLTAFVIYKKIKLCCLLFCCQFSE